jgi:beta-glucan synthesis-associated protein KRE6
VPSATRTVRENKVLNQTQQILRQGARPETPIRLEDLGRDYSRYPVSSPDRPSQRSQSNAPGEIARSIEGISLLRTTTNTPFTASQPDLEGWGYLDDGLGSFNPYCGGEKRLILYTDEIEPDDKYHLPADDDNEIYKAK